MIRFDSLLRCWRIINFLWNLFRLSPNLFDCNFTFNIRLFRFLSLWSTYICYKKSGSLFVQSLFSYPSHALFTFRHERLGLYSQSSPKKGLFSLIYNLLSQLFFSLWIAHEFSKNVCLFISLRILGIWRGAQATVRQTFFISCTLKSIGT